jgi:protein TonB
MNKSPKTVMNYLAAFFAAVVLHAGLAVGLGGFLNSGADGVPVTERMTQKDALVLTFYQPKPAELQSESTESIAGLQASVPAPDSEPSSQDPALKTPENNSPAETEGLDAPKPVIKQQSTETAAQPPTAFQPSHQQGQTFSKVRIEKPRPLQPIDAEAVYPLGARLRGEEGAVRILVRISADGRIDDLEIRESSGFTGLDRAAERAVRRTRFAPATRSNQPVAGELTITIRFNLDS